MGARTSPRWARSGWTGGSTERFGRASSQPPEASGEPGDAQVGDASAEVSHAVAGRTDRDPGSGGDGGGELPGVSGDQATGAAFDRGGEDRRVGQLPDEH